MYITYIIYIYIYIYIYMYIQLNIRKANVAGTQSFMQLTLQSSAY